MRGVQLVNQPNHDCKRVLWLVGPHCEEFRSVVLYQLVGPEESFEEIGELDHKSYIWAHYRPALSHHCVGIVVVDFIFSHQVGYDQGA